MEPTLAGFIAFIRDFMGISDALLPDDSIYIEAAYQVSLATVNKQMQAVGAPSSPFTSIYGLAVYNLGGDRVINYAQDLAGSPVIPGSDPPLKFFAWTRSQWNIFGFTAGVVQSSSDEGTSGSFVVPKAFEALTIADLQYLKTPWGRTYLGFAQQFGPSSWGIT